MKFNINENIKKEDFLMLNSNRPFYSMMKPKDVKDKLGITNYGLKKLNGVLPVYKLSSRLHRYKSEDVFNLVDKIKNGLVL
jgi:hypothetical protein